MSEVPLYMQLMSSSRRGPPRDRILGRARLGTESWDEPASGRRTAPLRDRERARRGTESSPDPPRDGV
jgi:hypothetical protein